MAESLSHMGTFLHTVMYYDCRALCLPGSFTRVFYITLSQKFIFNLMYFKHHLSKLKIDIFITHHYTAIAENV